MEIRKIKKNEKSIVFLIFQNNGLNHFLKSLGRINKLKIKQKKEISAIHPKKNRGKWIISSCPKVGLNQNKKKKITTEKMALIITLCIPFSIKGYGFVKKEMRWSFILFYTTTYPESQIQYVCF